MKVRGLDNKTYTLTLTGHVPVSDDSKRSSYHLRARDLLTNLFPRDRILEEVPLPGSGGLTADFFIPLQKLMIEVHGQQHYEVSTLFHNHYVDFLKGQQRDGRKRRWCELNNIDLVELPYNERDDAWEQRILRRQAS